MANVHELSNRIRHDASYLKTFASHIGSMTELATRFSDMSGFLELASIEIKEREIKMGQVQQILTQLESTVKGQQATITDLQNQLTAAKNAPSLDAADQQALTDAQTFLAGLGGGTPAPAPAPAPAPGPMTLKAISTPVGNVLATSENKPVYVFDGQNPDVNAWPPVTAQQASGHPALNVSNGHVNFNGRQLYTYKNDAPNQVTGDGAQGQWHVVKI